MKAISLWQPWASAVALGSKRIETRSWRTHYEGPLLIHAAKRRNIGELIHFSCCHSWQGALAELLPIGCDARWYDRLAFGAIVGVVDLIICRPTHDLRVGEIKEPRHPPEYRHYKWTEELLGDYGPNRWAWILDAALYLKHPIPFKGKQGLFDVPDSLLCNTNLRLAATA